jgi:UDP-2,3-diacylglucosamine pyrophosphatase LpxH
MQIHDGVRHIRSIRISDALVIHGDQFHTVAKYAKWLTHPGDKTYTGLLIVNTCFNHVRRKLGFTYWSLPAYLKHRVKNAVEMEGVLYCNDGDWVESCAALVDPASGKLPIVAWAASRRLMPAKAAA